MTESLDEVRSPETVDDPEDIADATVERLRDQGRTFEAKLYERAAVHGATPEEYGRIADLIVPPIVVDLDEGRGPVTSANAAAQLLPAFFTTTTLEL